MKKKTKTIVFALLAVYALSNIYPILWMLFNSFKTETEYIFSPNGLPQSINIDNYRIAWQTAKFSVYFKNSLINSSIVTVVVIMVSSLAAYFLSRFEFRFNNIIYVFFLLGMLIPLQTTLVPLFLLEKHLGILNERIGVILPGIAVAIPTAIFVLTSFMKTFSKSIEEAAIIEGCGPFTIFWNIILPMSRPAVATVTILTFIGAWNSFIIELVILNKDSLKTIPLGLQNFVGQYSTNFPAQMAGLVIAIIPIFIIYFLLEDYIVKGMTGGAIKG